MEIGLVVTHKLFSTAKELFNKHGIPTFAVAFGTGISSSGYKRFTELAEAGGTKKTIIAKTAESLKTQLQAAISQIIASKLSFTAPVIMPGMIKHGAFFSKHNLITHKIKSGQEQLKKQKLTEKENYIQTTLVTGMQEISCLVHLQENLERHSKWTKPQNWCNKK